MAFKMVQARVLRSFGLINSIFNGLLVLLVLLRMSTGYYAIFMELMEVLNLDQCPHTLLSKGFQFNYGFLGVKHRLNLL